MYRIADPALRFWFSVYSPHRSRWASYSDREKADLLSDHSGAVFEDWVRGRFPGARRYWESQAEIDLVREERSSGKGRPVEKTLVATEIKWRKVSSAEARSLAADLEARFRRTALGRQARAARFEVIDSSFLGRRERREVR